MTTQTLVLLATGLPAVIFLAKAVKDYSNIEDTEDYYLAGRKISIFQFAINAAASNFSFITAISVTLLWSFLYGIDVWWTIISALVGFIIFSISKISPIKDKKFFEKGNTVHEYLGERYDSKMLRKIASGATITAFIGFLSAEIYLFGQFLNIYADFGAWTWIFILSVIICLYTYLGGFKSVVETDKLQLFFILLGLGGILYMLFSQGVNFWDTFMASLEINTQETNFNSPPPLFIIMLFIINGLWQFSAMDMWQRSLAANNQEKIEKAARWGGVLFFVLAVPIILIGVVLNIQLGAESGIADPAQLIEVLLQNEPALLIAILFAFFISAFLSTSDSNLIALSQTFYEDIFDWRNQDQEMTDTSNELFRARLFVPGIVIVSLFVLYLFMNYLGGDIISFLLTFFSCQIVLFPSIIYAVYNTNVDELSENIKLPSTAAITSIIVGYISAIFIGYLSVSNPELQSTGPVIAFGLSFSIFCVVIPFSKK